MALNAKFSAEQARKNRQLNETRLVVRSTSVYHRKHGIPTPAELAEPGFKEAYEVALKGEQTYWIAQCMRWFDVDMWKKGQRELEEVYSSQEKAKRQAEGLKRKREELVKSCHALNLKLWDPKDRTFGDGRARYATQPERQQPCGRRSGDRGQRGGVPGDLGGGRPHEEAQN